MSSWVGSHPVSSIKMLDVTAWRPAHVQTHSISANDPMCWIETNAINVSFCWCTVLWERYGSCWETFCSVFFSDLLMLFSYQSFLEAARWDQRIAVRNLETQTLSWSQEFAVSIWNMFTIFQTRHPNLKCSTHTHTRNYSKASMMLHSCFSPNEWEPYALIFIISVISKARLSSLFCDPPVVACIIEKRPRGGSLALAIPPTPVVVHSVQRISCGTSCCDFMFDV